MPLAPTPALLLLPTSPARDLPRPPADAALAWPPAALALLVAEYGGRGDAELAQRLMARFGYQYDGRQVEHRRHVLGLHRTAEQVAAIVARNHTLGRGQGQRRRQPDGTETIRHEPAPDGRRRPVRYIRVGGRSLPLAVYLWEQAHGPVPAGYLVAFRDGNALNCVLDNLHLLTRADNAARNRNNAKAARSRAEYYAARQAERRAEYEQLAARRQAVEQRLALLRSGARDEQYTREQTAGFVAALEAEHRALEVAIYRLPESAKAPSPGPAGS